MKTSTARAIGLIYYLLLTTFLLLPIGVLILFSFNDSSLLIFPLSGFTTRWNWVCAGDSATTGFALAG